MAYKVLYRKYRPSRFADVVGQPQVTETLKSEIVANRVSHAYLFTGSRGTGKTTCAKILAKAVNCEHPVNGDPCGECETCKGLDNGSILDVVELDAASNNGVDDIRDIIEQVNFTPTNTKYRVYIIDEVHMLSGAAFNALLKTLEEPPSHVIFILATTEVHKLLPTILSRCQRFDFRRISPEDIAGRLEWVCEQEGATIDHEAALKIARIADGGMRDALSILDQCLGRSAHVDEAVVDATAGSADTGYLFDLAECVKNRDSSKALQIVADLHAESKDMSRLCTELTDHFRDLMLIKTVDNLKILRQMINKSDSEFKKLEDQAISHSMEMSIVLHSMDTLRNALDRMRFGNQRIEMEMAMVRLCSPQLDSSAEALIRRIEALESGKKGAGAVIPESIIERIEALERGMANAPRAEARPVSNTQRPAPAVTGEPVKPAEPPKSEEEIQREAVPFPQWPEVVERIRAVMPSAGSAFTGTKAYTSGAYILVEAKEIAFSLLRIPTNRDKIKTIIRDVTGRSYKLGPYRGEKITENKEPDAIELLAKRAEEASIEVNYTE
ncbi:MAG: DNA polymerase III subunit gamma/tau [Clostridia bacterium]|nr:DNA polymerase III subunit gamma/tau [Clostridia bacterium]